MTLSTRSEPEPTAGHLLFDVPTEPELAEDHPGPSPAATARQVHVPAVLVVLGGVLVASGSIMPWVRQGTVSAGGMEGHGLITTTLGATLVLIGLAGTTNVRRARHLRSLAILGGIATFLIAVVDLWNVSFERATPARVTFEPAIGEGLWVVLVGSVVALAGAIRSTGISELSESSRS